MVDKVDDKYSSYVHIGNSGYTVGVEVERGDDGYASQYLTTSLHSYGMPHETRMWLDENVIEALEYIVAKAREQREAIPELSYRNWSWTEKAVPPHTRESRGEACDSNGNTDIGSVEPE